MRSMLAGVVAAVLLVGGCSSSRHGSAGFETDSDLARRAASLRGATDAQWEAIRAAHDQGKRLDSKYVFAIGELRTGAIRAQTMAVIGSEADRRETDQWLKEAEAALPKVIAAGPMTQQAGK